MLGAEPPLVINFDLIIKNIALGLVVVGLKVVSEVFYGAGFENFFGSL
jgi:hypothetical protein